MECVSAFMPVMSYCSQFYLIGVNAFFGWHHDTFAIATKAKHCNTFNINSFSFAAFAMSDQKIPGHLDKASNQRIIGMRPVLLSLAFVEYFGHDFFPMHSTLFAYHLCSLLGL